VVFVDEADQSLGRRNTDGDSGVSGRVYSMMAEEMGDPANRGRVLWVLASSRPDLIEVDLKRPGRIDVKIPLFPTATPAEGFHLIQALCRKLGVAIDDDPAEFAPLIPLLLTAGAAEALAIKVYREARTRSLAPVDALRQCLAGYQIPVPHEVLDIQIQLAVQEASDLDFVPPMFRRQ
jgi:SpoVK/Ycf46/Vps4 family AAA+-type ATPase